MAEEMKLIDKDLLKEKIDASGLKIGFICERLGISRQAFDMKRRGSIPFKFSEILVLCELLRIEVPEEMKAIFLPNE